jgi:hypothetical protein
MAGANVLPNLIPDTVVLFACCFPICPIKRTIMDDGLIEDETTFTTARGLRLWWKQLSLPTKRLVGASLAVVLLVSCSLTAHTVRSHRRECREYAQDTEMGAVFDNDNSFGFSMAWHTWGYYYSYKQTTTGSTQGPRILLLLDVWKSSNPNFWMAYGLTRKYCMKLSIQHIQSDSVAYSVELSIGQDANGGVVWSDSEDDDDNVIIDPSAVHLSFSNGASYSVYNDTVFFISYAFSGDVLQVQERAVDLKGVSRQCGMKHLFQRNADLAAFDAQYQTGRF